MGSDRQSSDAAIPEKHWHFPAVDTVVVSYDIFGLITKCCSLAKLLNYPKHCRMVCDSKVNNFSAFWWV